MSKSLIGAPAIDNLILSSEAPLPSSEYWFLSVLRGFIRASGHYLMLAAAACASFTAWLRSPRTKASDLNTSQAMRDTESIDINEDGGVAVILTESEEVALKNSLTNEYIRQYSPEKDNVSDRTLKLTLIDDASLFDLGTLCIEKAEVEELRQLGCSVLMALSRNEVEINESPMFQVQVAKFILMLIKNPNLHHLDLSACYFDPDSDSFGLVQTFLNNLLNSNITITRISFHADNQTLDEQVAEKINLHRQIYIAEKIAVKRSLACPATINAFHLKPFLKKTCAVLSNTYNQTTATLIAVVDRVSEIDSANPQSSWSILKSHIAYMGQRLRNAFLQPMAESLESIVEPEVNVSNALVVSSRQNTGQFFSAYVAAPVMNFFTSITLKKEVERWILFDESADKDTKLTQCTTEVERILALWQQWKSVESNGYFSRYYKNKKREELFSAILYDGLVRKLPVDPTKEEKTAQVQKFLVGHSDKSFDPYGGNQYYGAEADKIKALYNQAFAILRVDMKEWSELPVSEYSAIRRSKVEMNFLNKWTHDYTARADDYIDGVREVTREVGELEVEVALLMEEQRQRDALEEKFSLNSMSDTESAVPGEGLDYAQSSFSTRTILIDVGSVISLDSRSVITC